MRLSHILNSITPCETDGNSDPEIVDLAYDSRQVKPGGLFVALKGYSQDGHAFIRNAIENGAVAVVGESFENGGRTHKDIIWVKVPDSRRALPKLAANFYDHPVENMHLVGITGTNGKTTTSYLLESILLAAGRSPGVIGTINYRYPGKTWKATVTTPGSLELMQTFREMADAGVSDVVMEVSSHALDQGRVEECPFRIAVFTNITRDHLDYHHSMEKYFKAKSLLFQDLRDSSRAVINGDDPRGRDLAEISDAPVMTYGLGKNCHVRADHIRSSRAGISAKLITPSAQTEIRSSLIGDFNIYNILAASAAALCMDIDMGDIKDGIRQIKGVPGRLESVENRQSLTIIVDYAHTPDALIKTLGSVGSLVEKGHVITVFGCGGDRDKGKRREMGYAAGRHSDWVVVTSDNPRSEDPDEIIAQIEKGVIEAGMEMIETSSADGLKSSGYIIDPDRGSAIRKAIKMADKSDIILIAGKGHEDYQIIGKNKRHFDDREVAAEAAS